MGDTEAVEDKRMKGFVEQCLEELKEVVLAAGQSLNHEVVYGGQ